MSSKLKLCSDGSDLVWFWYKVKTRIWQIRTGRKVIEWILNILRMEKQFHLQPLREYNKMEYSNISMSSSVKAVLIVTTLGSTNVTEFEKAENRNFLFSSVLKCPKIIFTIKITSIDKQIKINQRYKSGAITVYKRLFSVQKFPAEVMPLTWCWYSDQSL